MTLVQDWDAVIYPPDNIGTPYRRAGLWNMRVRPVPSNKGPDDIVFGGGIKKQVQVRVHAFFWAPIADEHGHQWQRTHNKRDIRLLVICLPASEQMHEIFEQVGMVSASFLSGLVAAGSACRIGQIHLLNLFSERVYCSRS